MINGCEVTGGRSGTNSAIWRLLPGVPMKRDPAALAAHRAYIKALAVGAAAYTAFDVACAAYRASWPGVDDSELRNLVAGALALIGPEQPDADGI
jgi:hypothetical protein